MLRQLQTVMQVNQGIVQVSTILLELQNVVEVFVAAAVEHRPRG